MQNSFNLISKGMIMILQAQTSAAIGVGDLIAAIPRFQLDYKSFSKLRELVLHKSLPLAGNSRFASHLALYFPEVAEQIEEGDFGILHLEVGALKLATRNAIDCHDWDYVRKYFTFVANMLENAGAELRDALHVSYLGNLFYGETSLDYAKARILLPKPLTIALEKVERHYEELYPGSLKLNERL